MRNGTRERPGDARRHDRADGPEAQERAVQDACPTTTAIARPRWSRPWPRWSSPASPPPRSAGSWRPSAGRVEAVRLRGVPRPRRDRRGVLARPTEGDHLFLMADAIPSRRRATGSWRRRCSWPSGSRRRLQGGARLRSRTPEMTESWTRFLAIAPPRPVGPARDHRRTRGARRRAAVRAPEVPLGSAARSPLRPQRRRRRAEAPEGRAARRARGDVQREDHGGGASQARRDAADAGPRPGRSSGSTPGSTTR